MSDLTVGRITQLSGIETQTPENKEKTNSKNDALQRIAKALEGIERELRNSNISISQTVNSTPFNR